MTLAHAVTHVLALDPPLLQTCRLALIVALVAAILAFLRGGRRPPFA